MLSAVEEPVGGRGRKGKGGFPEWELAAGAVSTVAATFWCDPLSTTAFLSVDASEAKANKTSQTWDRWINIRTSSIRITSPLSPPPQAQPVVPAPHPVSCDVAPPGTSVFHPEPVCGVSGVQPEFWCSLFYSQHPLPPLLSLTSPPSLPPFLPHPSPHRAPPQCQHSDSRQPLLPLTGG